MVDDPVLALRLAPADSFSITGNQKHRIQKIVHDWFRAFSHLLPEACHQVDDLPVQLALTESPRPHAGFGSGTQLAFSVSALLCKNFDIDFPPITALASVLNRGRRSLIGSYGFLNGGFLVDRGTKNGDNISQLDLRLNFPFDWRIVLFTPVGDPGTHGNLENATFEELAGNVQSQRERLVELCSDKIVPAIAEANYEQLGDSLYEFNRKSGEYFSKHQFGCYKSELCQSIVDDIRRFGISSAGQSSWGPCIFAIAENDQQANDLISELKNTQFNKYDDKINVRISRANNCGAKVAEESISDAFI